MIKWDGGGGKGDLLERSRRELSVMTETITLDCGNSYMVHTFVKTYQFAHLKSVHLAVCRLNQKSLCL